MATVKHNPGKTKMVKTVISEESFILTLSKDEALLLYGILGSASCTGKWGDLSYKLYSDLDDLGVLNLDKSPYNLIKNPIKFDNK